MNQKRLWIAATIIAFVIIIGFVLSVPHTREVTRVFEPEPVATVPSVTIHDVFKKGTHTITGSLMAPNACASVTAYTSLEGDVSSAERSILVALTISTGTGICLELPTRVTFSTTIVAPAQVPILVTVDGSTASTTPS